MPLFGTFDTMALTDVVQWLAHTEKTGLLTITLGIDETLLGFEKGNIDAVSSGDSLRLDFGQFLLSQQKIDDNQLQELMRDNRATAAFKKAVVTHGIVAYSEMAQLEHRYVQELLLELFFETDGSFHFAEQDHTGLLDSDAATDGKLESPFSSTQILMDAMKRMDDWERIREIFPSVLTVVKAVGKEGGDSTIWQDLKQVGRPISIGDFCLRLGMGRFNVSEALYKLHIAGKVALEGKLADTSENVNHDSVGTLVENATLLLEERQFEESREVLTTVLGLAPENRDAKILLKSLREQQLQYLYSQIPPHKTPLLCVPREQLQSMSLGHKELYLAERLNDKWDVAMLAVATPLGELDTLRILLKLIHGGIAQLR